MNILLCSMPDTIPQFSAKTRRAPNLAISSIAGNKHTGGSQTHGGQIFIAEE